MKQVELIDLSRYRSEKRSPKKRKRRKARGNGSVFCRSGVLWVDFRYLGERVRESSGLEDSAFNRRIVRNQLDLVLAEIKNGVFVFANRFPKSNRKDYFTELEGRQITRSPDEIIFGDYYRKWWKEMKPGMSDSQIRDYTSILKCHILPYFGKRPFSDFRRALMKKFVALLKSKQNSSGQLLSAKRIQNIMIPLRVIVRDAMDEYLWDAMLDPFAGLKLPKVKRFRVCPFTFEDWQALMKRMPVWYRPYFEFAVQTGLRPSEQVALKWSAIDDRFVYIELSRIRNKEKADLKTDESRRSIELRPAMKSVLAAQKKLTASFDSSYVFINTYGRPILQDKLREMWERVIKKCDIRYRRMYETRHTFASWALAAGESPEWVARTLGHVNSQMVYRTYGRYIPNLTRRDGSAFERLYSESTSK